MKSNQNLSCENVIERAYKIAAKVIAQCGEQYLPIFERLHHERQNFKTRADMKSLAMQVHINSK